MRVVRERLRFANVISVLALFVALGGASYAALELPRNSVGTTQLRNGAVTRAKVNPKLLAALKGRRGVRGRTGAAGAAGAPGAAGVTGAAGLLLDALPSGKSLRGVYSVGGGDGLKANSETGWSAVTFQLPLASAPTPHFISKGSTPPAECPGNVSSPAAAPGHLCVYEGGQVANGPVVVFDPTTQYTSGSSRFGFGLYVTPGFDHYEYETHGTWAVTAP
jgi:hypothetical protein